MPPDAGAPNPMSYSTLGELLRYLRERAHLTQRELASLVGYHFSYISYLERNLRTIEEPTLMGRFVPALGLEDSPEWSARLVELSKLKKETTTIGGGVIEAAVTAEKTNNLPINLTSMIGREYESARLRKIILNPDVRLVSVLGPPGIGKTCLALNIAHTVQPAFKHGVVFVDLASVRETQYLMPAIAIALQIPVSVTLAVEEAVKSALSDKNLLLVLDNFEQVIESAPHLLPLLGAAPAIKILVTSREVLRLRGEQELHLAPLPIPPKDGQPLIFDLLNFPAVGLFVERAQAVKPEFKLDETNASHIAEICSRLDGLPLALELAAARIRTMSLASMLEQFDRRLDWLSQGARDQPEWRQTLAGAIEWSVNLLTEPERTLFHRLSIFSGGWTLAAAEEICSDDVLCERSKILSLLIHLMEKSLVLPENEDGRFLFLETLREFAYTGLKKGDEFETLRKKHFEYYFAFIQTAKPNIRQGAHQLLWLGRTEREQPNLRLALEWVVEKKERAKQAMEFGACIHVFWSYRAYIREARYWLEKILALDISPSAARANLLRFTSDYASSLGDYAQAQIYEEEAMNISKTLGDEEGIYFSMDGMAMLAGIQGNYSEAAKLLEEVLKFRRRQTDNVLLSATLNNLAIATRRLGNLDHAKQLFSEAIQINRETQNLKSLAHSLNGLADVLVQQGELNQALSLLKESTDIRMRLSDMKGVAYSLSALATVAEKMGNEYQAVRLESTSAKMREEIGVSITPAVQTEKEDFLNQLREKLGQNQFDNAWSDGQIINLEQTKDIVIKL